MRRSLLTLAIGAALFQPHAFALSHVPGSLNASETTGPGAREIRAGEPRPFGASRADASSEAFCFIRLLSWAGTQVSTGSPYAGHELLLVSTSEPRPATLMASLDHLNDRPRSSQDEWLRWVRSHVRSE